MPTFAETLDAAEIKHYAQQKMLVEPTHDQHLATKKWVEELVEGMRWNAVSLASADNLAGALDGTFQILTASANEVLPDIDGVTASLNSRILLFGQTDGKQNGIYVVTDLGSVSTPWILTRASDANKGSEFAPNKVVWVRPGGDEFGDTNYKQSTGTDVVLGTTIIEFMATYSGSFDEEIVEITGADVPFEVSVTHSLNTKFVTGNAVDADFNEARFVYVATDSSHVKVLSGAIIPAGVKFQIMLRGRVVV